MNSRLFNAFNNFEEKVVGNLAILLFAVASLIVVAEVVGRYFFGHSFMWAQETVTYLTACSAFLYFGLTEGGSGLSSGHLRVDLVMQLIRSERVKRIVIIISTLVGIGYCLMFIWLALPYNSDVLSKKGLKPERRAPHMDILWRALLRNDFAHRPYD